MRHFPFAKFWFHLQNNVLAYGEVMPLDWFNNYKDVNDIQIINFHGIAISLARMADTRCKVLFLANGCVAIAMYANYFLFFVSGKCWTFTN